MADILVERQTHILVSRTSIPPLYPANNLFPSDDVYPRDADLIEVGNIVAGSMQLDEMLVDKEPVWGLFFSSKFEVRLFNVTEDLSDRYIHVYQEDRGVRQSVFTGYVDSCKKDKLCDDRTIVAYDPAYYWGSLDISDWWSKFWQRNPDGATLHEVRTDLLATFMFPYEDVILPNDNMIVKMNINVASGSFAAIIKMLCELSCSYPHFDRDGMLRFILFNTGIDPIDLTGRYEWNASDFEEYETLNITGVQFFDSGDQLKRTIGDAENAYGIYQNAFTYSMSTVELDTLGQTMLQYLQDFKFVPSKIKMIVGDFNLNLGDYVKTEFGNFYIFKNSYSGSQLIEQTISANGSMKLNSVAQAIDFKSIVLSEQVARVEQNVEHFYIEYGNTVQNIYSTIEQTADTLSFKIDAQTTSAYLIMTINQNGDSGKVVSSVELAADVIDIRGIVKLLEAEEIRTVLNGGTGYGEVSQFIRYRGDCIQFYEGSYEDGALNAVLSYNGLDYYRNDEFIGRYTIGAFVDFPWPNIFQAAYETYTAGGISRERVDMTSYRFNGTSDIGSAEYIRISLCSVQLIGGRRYRFSYTRWNSNLPVDGVQIIAICDGFPKQPLLICDLTEVNNQVSFLLPAVSQTSNCLIALNIYKSGIVFNYTGLQFYMYDVSTDSNRQYGLDTQLRSGEFWAVSTYSPDQTWFGQRDLKLLYAREPLYVLEDHTGQMYAGDTIYAMVPTEFRKGATIYEYLHTNSYPIRYDENTDLRIQMSDDRMYIFNQDNTISFYLTSHALMLAHESDSFITIGNLNSDWSLSLQQPTYLNNKTFLGKTLHTLGNYIQCYENSSTYFTVDSAGIYGYTNGGYSRFANDGTLTVNTDARIVMYSYGQELIDGNSSSAYFGYGYSSIYLGGSSSHLTVSASTIVLSPSELYMNGYTGYSGSVVSEASGSYSTSPEFLTSINDSLPYRIITNIYESGGIINWEWKESGNWIGWSSNSISYCYSVNAYTKTARNGVITQ